MVASHQIHIVVDVVRIGYIVGVNATCVELKTSTDHKYHVAWGIRVGIDADIGWAKELDPRPADDHSSHPDPEGIYRVRAHQVRTTQREPVREILVTSIGCIQRQQIVCDVVGMGIAVPRYNVSLENGVLGTLLIINFLDELILVRS